jgi:hypothetical protein
LAVFGPGRESFDDAPIRLNADMGVMLEHGRRNVTSELANCFITHGAVLGQIDNERVAVVMPSSGDTPPGS